MSSEERLEQAFPSNRAALVAYLMAGYPNREGSLEALRETAAAGADVIELGVPYSDALADGPVIARAANAAMTAAPGGFGLVESISLAAELLADSAGPTVPPVLLMTYVNPVRKMGFDAAAEAAVKAGIAGFIIQDLPPDNPVAKRWLDAARARGLATVFLVAPTSTPERMEAAVDASRGFVYCVSSTGVTGERAELDSELGAQIGRIRSATTLPVAVGFGISTPEQAASVARLAEGVVVGSAIVRRQPDARRTGEFVAALAAAIGEIAR